LFPFISGLFAGAQAPLSLEQILEKNVRASGSREKLADSEGRMKTIAGKDPVITEVILIDRDRVRRNAYNEISEITGPIKSVYIILARLYSGLFTLSRFEGRLEFQGIRSYGPEKFYELTTGTDTGRAGFFLRQEDFTLKRVVFQGLSPEGEGDKYEINYDFGPFEEQDGLMLPTCWFSSQVGTRGNLYEISNIQFNPELKNDFFSNLDVSVGSVEASEGSLKGHVLDSMSSAQNLVIITNWLRKNVKEAGFKTNDRLTLSMEGIEEDIVFYESPNEMPPRETFAKGARIMTINPRMGETYIIQFFGFDFSQVAAKIKPLVPIQVKRQ
jgi:hypothetical protein